MVIPRCDALDRGGRIRRNRWPLSVGISGRIQSESVAAFDRNGWPDWPGILTFKRFRRQAILCGRHMPRCLKPCRQRSSRFVENCPSGDRCLVPTARTHQAASSLLPRTCSSAAGWTTEAAWPTQPLQVCGASCVIVKPARKLTVGARIVTSGDQPARRCSNKVRPLHPYILC